MEAFHQNLLIGTAILLVVWFGILAFLMHRSRVTAEWPPATGDCPDYWVDLGTGGSQCHNEKQLGSCADDVDFTKPKYTGQAGVCAKYHWARKCGVVWDGITSQIQCEETPSNLASIGL